MSRSAKAREEYIALLIQNGMTPGSGDHPGLSESAGRTTAEAVYARISSPHYNASAMDGIALDAGLTFGATETTPVVLSKGPVCHRLTRVTPCRPGCDAVVMVEDVIEDENGVRLYQAATPWQHIRQIGEDICAGEMLLPSLLGNQPLGDRRAARRRRDGGRRHKKAGRRHHPYG